MNDETHINSKGKTMSAVKRVICCAVVAISAAQRPVLAGGMAEAYFTYQGQLKEAGVPVNGAISVMFTLYNAPELGDQIGAAYWPLEGVEVLNGLFSVEVDVITFGPDAFNGDPRWLQIAVDNGGGWVDLSPRQPITPAPYALYAYDSLGGGGGDSIWSASGADIYYIDGLVGVGTEYPWAQMTVIGNAEVEEAVYVENSGNGVSAVLGGMSAAVEGNADVGEVSVSGVVGRTDSMDRAGVYGANYSFGSGICAGVWGYTPNPNGYAGYFDGRGYFTDEVGVGRIPTTKLDVAGTVRMDGFLLTDSPMAGYVLTADSTGEGSWQPGGGGGNSYWTIDGEGINYQAGHVGIGADSTGLAGLNVTTGGQQAIHAHNSNASAQTFALYAEADSTLARTIFGRATAPSGATVGVFGWSNSPDGYGVFGRASAESGAGVGVHGESSSPNGFAGYFEGRGYFSGNVGIGTTTPGSPLTVNGPIESTSGGVKFPDGTTQTSAATGSGGESPWQQADSEIYYNSGNVGIGTTNPTVMLDVVGDIKVEGFRLTDAPDAGFVLTSDAQGYGSWEPSSGGDDSLWQPNGNDIYFDVGDVGIGVSSPAAGLHLAGGQWDVANTEGDFKIGSGTYRLKMGVATAGGGAGHCRIFAAGPSSELILGAGGQDRLAVSDTKVDVDGPIEVDGFKLTDTPIAGYVLKCDSLGNGTWQPGGGGGGGEFDLPYEGSVTVNDDAFKITNSGMGFSTHAITGVISNAGSSDASAGFFNAVGSGIAVHAESDSSTTIYAHNSGSGKAFHGSTNGSGGGNFRSSMNGGYGVKGEATSSGSSSENRGGWFTATNSSGGIGVEAEGDAVGIKGKSTNSGGVGVRGEATGAESVGVYATSPYIAVQGSSSYEAGRFTGKLRVRRAGSTDTVFLVDSDGITKVDVLQIMGGADLSEQFDVQSDQRRAEPGMVVCIDPDNAGKLVVSGKSYDRTVAGIISGAGGIKTGMLMGQHETVADGAYPVALTGRVYVWADASNGAIVPGDLLTTSEVPGHAMKVTDHLKSHGATLGKAMTSLESGRGLVLVLVSLQ